MRMNEQEMNEQQAQVLADFLNKHVSQNFINLKIGDEEEEETTFSHAYTSGQFVYFVAGYYRLHRLGWDIEIDTGERSISTKFDGYETRITLVTWRQGRIDLIPGLVDDAMSTLIEEMEQCKQP